MSIAVGEQKIYNVFSDTLYHKPGGATLKLGYARKV